MNLKYLPTAANPYKFPFLRSAAYFWKISSENRRLDVSILFDLLVEECFAIKSRLVPQSRPREVLVKELRYGSLNLLYHRRAGDLELLAEVFLHNQYLKHPRVTLSPNSIVLDVGANAGYFTLLSASIATQGTVFAFEPNGFSADLMRKQIIRNNLTNVVIAEVALDDHEGECEFFVFENPFGGVNSFFRGHTKERSIPVKVQTTTLDEFAERHSLSRIDFLKVDVEGAELRVLRGGEATLKKVSCLAIEVHKQYVSCADVHDLLLNCGFALESAFDTKNCCILYAWK